MKKCKYCMSDIDANAKICPHCGKKQKKPIILIIAIVFVVLLVIGVASGNNDDSSNNNSESTNNGTTYPSTKEKFSYTIDSSYDDGYLYYIEGKVTNNTSKDYSYVQISFICYDAEGNNLGTAIDNTTDLLGNQTWKYKASFFFNDPVDHCDYHEITGW